MSESNRLAIEQQQLEGGTTTATSSAVDAAAQEWRRSFLPAFDQDATEVHLVYDAKEICGEAWTNASRVVTACWKQQDSDAVHALLHGGKQQQQWNECVVQALQSLTEPTKTQLKAAYILNHWILLCNRLSQKKFIPPPNRTLFFGAPLEVGQRFLELFTAPVTGDREVGFCMTDGKKDRCHVFLMILYVIMHGETMRVANIKPLLDQVKLDASNAALLLKAAGFKVERKGSDMAVKLTVPLTFPPTKSGSRKK